MYIHELKDWPNFTWNEREISPILTEARYLQGKLLGKMESWGFKLQEETTLKALTQDVLKTSEIEGEKLDYDQVRSSIAKKMGIKIDKPKHTDRNIDGIVEILIDATKNYEQPLSEKRLFAWHQSLFPSKLKSLQKINIGTWRGKERGDMQVVSGSLGREKIHFEAPSYKRIKKEMQQFIKWFNSNVEYDLVIKSAVAHFWFVTIHPFDDGNGRISRAISDMLLAKSEATHQRFYSMSSQIQIRRNSYYEILEKCQKSKLNITAWIKWYLECLKDAIQSSYNLSGNILVKASFWQKNVDIAINERQRKIMNLLLDGFVGKLTSSKYAKICKVSQDTAIRDINDLINKKLLISGKSRGRSTNYSQ